MIADRKTAYQNRHPQGVQLRIDFTVAARLVLAMPRIRVGLLQAVLVGFNLD